MGDSKEKARSGIITWLQGWLSERSGAFKCLSPALICIIFVLALRLYHAGGDVWGAVYQLFDTVLLTLFAAFTVSFAWEVLSKNALLRELQHHTDKAFQDAGLSNTLANQGILDTTTDFQQGIQWKQYIADADEIDVCWWAGLGWVQTHRPDIETAANKHKLRIRYVIPDTMDPDVLDQMVAVSGIKAHVLKSTYEKTCDVLQPLGNMVKLFNTKKLPQYGMVRLGSRIVFFPYSHLRGVPLGRPTFVIDATSELGKRFLKDFDDLIKSDETLHPLNF
jgi:hypothetical protein